MLAQINRQLKVTREFSVNNNHVYQGQIIGPDVVFDLDLIGDVSVQTFQQIGDIITATWMKKNPGKICTLFSMCDSLLYLY